MNFYFLQAYDTIKTLFKVCLFYGDGDQAQNFLYAGKALYYLAAPQPTMLSPLREAGDQARTHAMAVGEL